MAAKYKTGEEILCPMGTAHEPQFEDVLDQSWDDLENKRVLLSSGEIVRLKGAVLTLAQATAPSPVGLKVELPQPTEGRRHSAVFEELPEGYATERWGGARKEEPYLRCPVCGATFPVWGIEEYLASQE
jgi:hypothetical protein